MERELSIGRTVATTWLGDDFVGTIISDKGEDGRYDIEDPIGILVIRKLAKDIRVLF